MNLERLRELYKEYGLSVEDTFKHRHYTIITRSGIDKIQAKAKINIQYEAIRCEPDFCVFKATGSHESTKIETFGSAKHSTDPKNGSTTSWYVAEMAEKRAMSRAVLKLTGFYELGVFGEDESEQFKK